jgi:hypothetical protein
MSVDEATHEAADNASLSVRGPFTDFPKELNILRIDVVEESTKGTNVVV